MSTPKIPLPRSTATRWQFVVAAVLSGVLVWSPLAKAGDLNTEMQNFFNEVGVMGSVTGPTAFRGQTMNLYTGGELHMRTPIRNYQLFSFTLPGLKASCGGIDMWAGSFGHLSQEQWEGLLKNIAKQAALLYLESALKSLSPFMHSLYEKFQHVLQMANNGNINSCQMAKQLVSGVANMMAQDAYESCVRSSTDAGKDETTAREECRKDTKGGNTAAKESGDAARAKIPPRDLNLLWHALSNTDFSTAEKLYFINIVGTWTIHGDLDAGPALAPREYQPAVQSVLDLITGTKTSSDPELIVLDGWWECQNLLADPNCLQMVQSEARAKPFTKHVRDYLVAMKSKMLAKGAEGELTKEELALINNTSVPIWKMLNIAYADPGLDVSFNYFIDRYSAVVAVDYAYHFMKRVAKEALMYLNQVDWRGRVEEEFLEKLRGRISWQIKQVEEHRRDVFLRLGNMHGIIEDMQRVERALYANVGARLKASIEWSAAQKTQARY